MVKPSSMFVSAAPAISSGFAVLPCAFWNPQVKTVSAPVSAAHAIEMGFDAGFEGLGRPARSRGGGVASSRGPRGAVRRLRSRAAR